MHKNQSINHQKGDKDVIENLVGKSKGTEYAERQLEQAKARLAEIKRKEGAERRKAENKHKYMMGGIVHKYFPECFHFDETEMNEILEAAIHSRECAKAIESVKNRDTVSKTTEAGKAKEQSAGYGDMKEAKTENADEE